LDFFAKPDEIRIIPVTARNLEQYQRTIFYREKRAINASLYFSGLILTEDQPDPVWQKQISEANKKLKTPVSKLLEKFDRYLDKEIFRLIDLDGYYVCIKNRDKKNNVYQEQNDQLVREIKEFVEDEYIIHYNDNNIALIPEFLDKKYAVSYLKEKFNPDLTIGAGDSLSDLNFMHLCDFRMFPGNSQIEKLIKNEDKNLV